MIVLAPTFTVTRAVLGAPGMVWPAIVAADHGATGKTRMPQKPDEPGEIDGLDSEALLLPGEAETFSVADTAQEIEVVC